MFEPFRCGVKGKASYLPLALTFVPAVRSRKLVRSSTPDACSTVSGREGGIHVAIAPGLVVGFANCSPMQPGWRVRPERGCVFGTFGAIQKCRLRALAPSQDAWASSAGTARPAGRLGLRGSAFLLLVTPSPMKRNQKTDTTGPPNTRRACLSTCYLLNTPA